ncbi:MAG: hypothetical protein COW71_08990 [Ignavibacteriales bacterium CG18_big_fil_WC_8_21_14_2_50_31_20]|nr:MAG: hypothetical protein COW71_08990 [Ignavibacteriales bacterium CG18_big_fil_WC_8_21_14_2_50_31_20]
MNKLRYGILFYFILNIVIYSQQDTTRGNFWINSAIPPFPEYNGLTLNYSVNYAIENLAFSLMAFHAEGESTKNKPDFYDLDFFSASVGYRLSYKYLMIASFLGTGYTRISDFHQELKGVKTIGLISNIQIYTYPFTLIGFDGLGFGFELVSNFNTKHNYNFYHFSVNLNF